MSGWDLQWILSIGDPERDPAPHREHSTLTFHGTVHRPTPFRYPVAEIQLSGRPELPSPPGETRPRSIGFLDGRAGRLQAYVTVPEARLSMLAAAAGRVRLVALGGSRLLRGKGDVTSVHVDTTFIPEEW